MFLSIILLIIGMILLIKGADWFVEGSSNVAKALKISPLIIGLTLVSIGTSLPELSVSINSAFQGKTDMSFGNVVGSNIFNVLVVIGFSALFTPILIKKNLWFDLFTCIFIYILIALFAFVITPDVFDLFEAIALSIIFVVYMVLIVLRAKKLKSNEEENVENEKKPKKWYINALLIILGIAGIIGGGQLVVSSASKIAIDLGMSELLVALTIVAVGTSLPELVTSMVAAKKGENDIAIGNAIGSCIFNALMILGFSSVISAAKENPIDQLLNSRVDVIVMCISVLLIIFMAFTIKKVNRVGGAIMILIYVAYLVYIILRNVQPDLFYCLNSVVL